MNFQPFLHPVRLWDNDGGVAENLHRVVCFRRRFFLHAPCSGATLFVAADSDFIVCLDGREIVRGQYPDDPAIKSFDAVKLPELAAGEHLLAVKVYFCGGNFSGYTPGLPGLYVDWTLAPEKVSPWLVHNFDAFKNGEMPILTPQLGYTTEYDLRCWFDFADPDLDESTWQSALEFPAAKTLLFRERPAGTKCRLGEFRTAHCVKSGQFIQFDGVPRHSAAQAMTTVNCFADNEPKQFPVTFRNEYGYVWAGFWLIADLGCEETGFVEFEVEAPAGTRIDYAHGEHLDGGHIRAEICGRNFADSVICREGVNRFELPFRRVGARYLELHISGTGYAPVTVKYVGVKPWRLPLPEAAAFDCDKPAWLELRRRAIHTLELCMHEHYEDCPWREQGMYTYDSRTQILYGYRLWGNYEFVKASLELFRYSPREDRHLRLCVPSRMKTVIPVYSIVWMAELYEYYLYTGDLSLFKECREAAEMMLAARLAKFDNATGLFRTDDELWNFYEWTPGLNGHGDVRAEFHALYNLYLVEALDCYAKLLEALGESSAMPRDRAEALRKAVEKHFFDAEKGIYASFSGKDGLFGYHDHTQALMLTTAAAPLEKRAALYEVLDSHTLIPMTLSPLLYQVWAMENGGLKERKAIAEMVMKHYEKMLATDIGTLWETERGTEDFFYAGSLCHGWSALPVYILYTIVLGVKPLLPGFRSFSVAPVPGDMKRASGEVPAPAGKIKVEWVVGETSGYLKVAVPKGLTAEVDTGGFEVPMKVEVVDAE